MGAGEEGEKGESPSDAPRSPGPRVTIWVKGIKGPHGAEQSSPSKKTPISPKSQVQSTVDILIATSLITSVVASLRLISGSVDYTTTTLVSSPHCFTSHDLLNVVLGP